MTSETRGFLDEMRVEIARMRYSIDLLQRADALGLEMVYLNRQEALHAFIPYLQGYVERPESKLYIVGSSLKGAMETTPGLREAIQKAKPTEENRYKELFVLLTHPFYSSFRENQEDRSTGDIADEIFQSIRLLSQMGVEHVKLYKGTPTCFLIATDECMLLNPYPYEKEAYESFCMTVTNVRRPNSIYDQYIINHFLEPWSNRRGNALDFQYFALEGPNPEQWLEEGPDFFVIQDAREFYLAVFLRGRPGLPTVVGKERESEAQPDATRRQDIPEFIPLGDEFTVKLLRVVKDGSECNWEEFTQGAIYWNRDRRRGKVIGSHPGDFEEFSMVGVFSKNEKYQNPHKHKPEWAPLCLQGQPLPLFWRWLRPSEEAEASDQS